MDRQERRAGRGGRHPRRAQLARAGVELHQVDPPAAVGRTAPGIGADVDPVHAGRGRRLGPGVARRGQGRHQGQRCQQARREPDARWEDAHGTTPKLERGWIPDATSSAASRRYHSDRRAGKESPGRADGSVSGAGGAKRSGNRLNRSQAGEGSTTGGRIATTMSHPVPIPADLVDLLEEPRVPRHEGGEQPEAPAPSAFGPHPSRMPMISEWPRLFRASSIFRSIIGRRFLHHTDFRRV